MSRSQINRWLSVGLGQESAILVGTVLRIADTLGLDGAVALRAAGNLPPDDLTQEIEIIRGSRLPPGVQDAMMRRLMVRREDERLRRVADLVAMLEDRGRAG